MSPATKDITSIGLVGCGVISEHYLSALARFPSVRVTACADLDLARAKVRAEQFHIPKACSLADLLADPAIDIVLNLTIPSAHAEVALAALKAGKHIYNEKPLAATLEDGRKILAAAKASNLRAGCAPDTFLGAGYQTCRKLIDDGAIGKPFAATAFMTSHSHDGWPSFIYQPGGGPMLDMGPYYLTAMVLLLGPIRRVAGAATVPVLERTAKGPDGAAVKVPVQVPTHVAGLVEFVSGAVASIIQSSEMWRANLPFIEVHGTGGSLTCPDPNRFDGTVKLFQPSTDPAKPADWRVIPWSHGYSEPSRGLGPVDMAFAIREYRPHRSSAELAFHVLEAMDAFNTSWTLGQWVKLESTCEQPRPLPASSLMV
ncbi:MAG TPA: Gfo/Idh/MocA family oxidoreductase [Planctomycetota bacterium]|nr:Gfo/Idh/MocA family oxidoreductase [Planctomycetota bacterium]